MDRSADSVLICLLGTGATARGDMTFLGRQSYQDVAIPTII